MGRVKGSDIFTLVGSAAALTLLTVTLAASEPHPTIPADTTVEGKVVAVADADTLTVLVDKTQYRIRLAGIDAPEKGQPFGTKAREALADKVFGKTVKVMSQGSRPLRPHNRRRVRG